MKKKIIYYSTSFIALTLFLFYNFDNNLVKSLIIGFSTIVLIFLLNQATGVNKWFDKNKSA